MELLIQTDPRDLAFLVKVLEGCDGLAMIKTIDGHHGLAQLIYPTHSEKELRKLLQEINKKRKIEVLEKD